MADDGEWPDEVAGDGVYAMGLPKGALGKGDLVRWYVLAEDTDGVFTREPPFEIPTDSEPTVGAVVGDPELTSNLPIFQLFIENPGAAGTWAGTRAALWFGGELYDNVAVDVHGQSTSGFPKKSMDIDFNRDHRFRLEAGTRRMKDINLLTNWADKSRMRNTLAYEVYRDAGAAYHLAFPVRVQLNGLFHAVYDFVEDGDDRWLERIGLDPDGALYKVYDGLYDPAKAEKKTRKDDDKADVEALIAGLALPAPERTPWLMDHVDVPAVVDYAAAMVITAGTDCCHKNYYVYRAPAGAELWRMLPWDVDLTFGHNWTGSYFDDALYANSKLFIGKGNNALLGALFAVPELEQMVLRRVRTLMDELLQPPGTPPAALRFEARIAELLAMLGEDAALDEAKWGFWGTPQTTAEAAQRLVDEHLVPRRVWLYDAMVATPAQADVTVVFGPSELALLPDPEAWLTIENPGEQAVDLSGYALGGAVEMTFAPGTVVPVGGTLFVAADPSAFRARSMSPKGGEGLLVVGGFAASSSGSGLVLLDPAGAPVASLGALP
jgi:hypothetical protein